MILRKRNASNEVLISFVDQTLYLSFTFKSMLAHVDNFTDFFFTLNNSENPLLSNWITLMCIPLLYTHRKDFLWFWLWMYKFPGLSIQEVQCNTQQAFVHPLSSSFDLMMNIMKWISLKEFTVVDSQDEVWFYQLFNKLKACRKGIVTLNLLKDRDKQTNRHWCTAKRRKKGQEIWITI